MRDVTLYRRLLAREFDAPDLPELLAGAAKANAGERALLLGLLDPLLDSERPELRAGGVRLLGGGVSRSTLELICRALDDSHADVRGAAVEALIESVGYTHSARMAYALFHPRADVRLKALEHLPEGGKKAAFYLLADPETSAQARLVSELPPFGWPALFGFLDGGVLSESEARAYLIKLKSEELIDAAERGRARSAEQQKALLDQGATEADEGDSFDVLWRLVHGSGSFDEHAELLSRRLSLELRKRSADLRRRAAASLVAVAPRPLTEAVLEVLVPCEPRVLGSEWLGLAARRRSLHSLVRAGGQCPKLSFNELKPLLQSALVRREDASLDVAAVAALLHLSSTPYEDLGHTIDDEELLMSFVAAPLEGALLLAVPGARTARTSLFARIRARLPGKAAEFLGLLAWVMPSDELDEIEQISDGALAHEVCLVLLEMARRPGVRLSSNKLARLSTLLVPKLGAAEWLAVLQRFLTGAQPEENPFGVALLEADARAATGDLWSERMLALEPAALLGLLDALPFASGVPWSKERALAERLRESHSPRLRAWARERVPDEAAVALVSARRPAIARRIPWLERLRLVRAPEADVDGLVRKFAGVPCMGLSFGLRLHAPRVSLDVCTALLGCHDRPERVDSEFARFSGDDAAFLQALELAAVRSWNDCEQLPLLGRAWLYRWERHGFAFIDQVERRSGGFGGILKWALNLSSPLLMRRVWEAAAHCWEVLLARQHTRALNLWRGNSELLCAAEVDGEVGFPAARILRSLHRYKYWTHELRNVLPQLEARLPDCTDEVRRELQPIIDARGLPPRDVAARAARRPVAVDVLAVIRASTDSDALMAQCRDADDRVVQAAVLRLLELGGSFELGLVELLEQHESVPGWRRLVEAVPLFGEQALARVRTLARSSPDAELGFRLAFAFAERGEREAVEWALQAACQPATSEWFSAADYALFSKASPELRARLARSPHAHAYRPAVRLLIDEGDGLPERLALLADFLEAGTGRLHELRAEVALFLVHRADTRGLPLLFAAAVSDAASWATVSLQLSDAEQAGVARAVVLTGQRIPAGRVLQLLPPESTHAELRAEALQRLLSDTTHDSSATLFGSALRRLLSRWFERQHKLRAVAEVFAWGTLRGYELLGSRYHFHLLGANSLGYTRFRERRINVSAVPILRGDRHGREIVEGLVLHELGHHVYHAGEESEAVWKKAQQAKLHGLLNLVADEHLERNLRAVNGDYGDRFKRLAAFAFQHADRELSLDILLEALAERAFAVLSRTRLTPALRPGAVGVQSAALLHEMERAGLSFARFVRALRMGLGDRHADPRVARALALFERGFRKQKMAGLYEITLELQRIFGWEARLVETFGGHEGLPLDELDEAVHGEGLDDQSVQREVERVLDPEEARRRNSAEGAGGKGAGGGWINLSGASDFQPIREIKILAPDAAQHRSRARSVARNSRRLREDLELLGLARVVSRRRTSGQRFDSTSALAVVTRGDPRMLVARQVRYNTDLFIGALVDCSGSMSSDQNIEKARCFAVLLAEACRGLQGVDLRVFGFTDKVIYDAGDAQHCAAAVLEAGGGNNDAAALDHAARAARSSGRKARLLVMISDGLPTECTAQALKNLAIKLSRRENMCVAQVAVRPIEEPCFENFVLLEADDLDASVSRFGATVRRLVQRAIGG
jgi:hypothetical protein